MEKKTSTALVASPDESFCANIGVAAELADIRLVAQVAGYVQLPALLDVLQADILVLDADPPEVERNGQLASFHRSAPGTAILLATSTLTDERVSNALLQGVSGFVPKHCDRREYAEAMRAVQRGEIWLGREKLAHALTSLIDAVNLSARPRAPAGASEKLSPREEEIVGLISRGCTNKEIAKALGLSDKTVKAHLSHVFAKLGVTRRAQLALSRHPFGASPAGG